MFEVTVKTLDSKTQVFQIENENLKVSEFKEMVHSELEIPIDHQRLIFQGKALLDEKKLTEYGVQSKTIHLVTRPPPTTSQSTASAPETNDTPSSSSQFGPHFVQNIPWFPIQGIQRAAQTISQGILSGMSDFLRPSDMVVRTDPSGNMNIHMSLPLLARRDAQFRRLQRTARSLLNTLDGRLASREQETASVSPSEEAVRPSIPVSFDATGEAAPESTPSGTDVIAETTPNAESQPSSPLPQNVTLSRLADMLTEQRRLWTQIQPHLDRWEGMLRAESALQEPTNPTNPAEVSTESTQPMETSTETPQPEPMETTDCTTVQNWSQRYFNDISRLLHLQSHVLHLLSDFTVDTMPESTQSATQTTSLPTSTTEATAMPNVPEVVTPPSLESRPPTTRTRRVVNVQEHETQVLHAHINVEPTTVTFARPVGYVATPVRTLTTRRSQSAHPNLAAQTATNSDTNMPTAFIIERPVEEQPHSNESVQLDETHHAASIIDMLSFMDMTASPSSATNTQPTDSSTRTTSSAEFTTQPVPPPEANLTAEASLPQQLSRSLSNLLGENREGSARPQVAMSAPIFLPQFGNSSSLSLMADPFLPCQSRHFPNSLRQTRARHPVARSSGRVTRRRRSVDANLSGAQQEQTPTSNSTDLPQRPNQPEAAVTAHSVTIPLASAFSLNGADQHLNNLANIGTQVQRALTETLGGQGINIFGGPTQMNTSQSGEAQSRTAASVNQINPLFWFMNLSSTDTGQAASTPTVPSTTPTENYQEVTGETNLSHFPAVIIEGVIRTLWTFINDLAQNNSVSPPAFDVSNWALPSADNDTTSPFHQVFLQLRENIRDSGLLFNSSNVSQASMQNCVNGLRQPLRRLLPAEFPAGRDEARDNLARVLLSGCISDTETNANEASLAQWALEQATLSTPADFRRSLFNFLTHRVMGQMTMWRESPTNTGFGSLLMLTMHQMGLDLFGFADLLAKVAAERLGLPLNAGANGNSTGGGRMQTFGHCMSLDPLIQHVDVFLSSLPADSGDRSLLKIIRSGLMHCITTYCGLGAHGLSRYTGAPMNFIVFVEGTIVNRPPVAIATPNTVAINETSSPDLTSRNFKEMGNHEDSDSSDVYEDAHETTQTSSSAAANLTVPSAQLDTTETQSPSTVSPPPPLVSPLPQWHLPAEQTLPSTVAEALAPNPANSNIDWVNQHLNAGGDTLPPQWMNLATADSTQISINAGAVAADEEEMHYRLSDAYIAGMPAKRRRMMLDKKKSLLCPVGNIFSNLMTEAIGETESERQRFPASSGNVPPATSNLSEGDRSSAAGESTPELRGALKTFISDYLAKRLNSDPDFEPTRYSGAKSAFGKKSNS